MGFVAQPLRYDFVDPRLPNPGQGDAVGLSGVKWYGLLLPVHAVA
jgi:hypothetical protein